MTIEQEVAALTTATTALLGAVNVGKAVLDAKVLTATEQAANAQANATQVASVNTVATTQASAAAASALAAATSRDLAIAAWGASTAPAETLPAISQSIHVGTVVKSIIYDTAKQDSDGGAWRKRCTDKSWFTEALGGNRWIGQRASVGAAWTAAGSTAGAVYQSTADGKYYTPTSATVQTEVFRGITREFPEQAAIVAEAGRVVIYDLTVPGVPMWMVFIQTTNTVTGPQFFRGSRNVTSLAAIGGNLFLGMFFSAGDFNNGLGEVSFLKDEFSIRKNSVGKYVFQGISNRNSTTYPTAYIQPGSIVNTDVKDIAVTILDNAPTDPATGLPVPTIACLVGESLVEMADGTQVRIDQVKVGSKVKTLEGESFVTNWWDQGIKEVFEFEFDGGQKLTCTADHKIRTTVGWVEAGSLTSEHEVIGA